MGLPLIGETISFVRNSHRFFETRFRKHGPVFKTRILFSKVVCFGGPEAFTFFANEPGFDRADANPGHVQRLLGRHSLPLLGDAEHRRMKRIVMQAFRPEALETYAKSVDAALAPFLVRWEQRAEFSWLAEHKKLSATICDALLSRTEPPVDASDLVGVLDGHLAGLNALPVNLPWTKFGKALRCRDDLLEIIDEAITRRRRTPYDDILAELLEAKGDDGAVLTEEQLRDQMVHTFFATYGGLYRVLTLMCMSLALHPDMMERARAEVAQATNGDLPSLGLLSRMTYLDSFVREVRRHNRIFASTFLKRVAKAFEYGGYRVPAGWKAIGGIYATMQDPAVFADPAKFDADRFGPDRAEHLKEPNGYIPQGGGPPDGHRCPGEDLTTIVMKVVAARLLQSYTWELPPQDLTLDSSPNPLPRDGVKVRFRRI